MVAHASLARAPRERMLHAISNWCSFSSARENLDFAFENRDAQHLALARRSTASGFQRRRQEGLADAHFRRVQHMLKK